ncbi:hypothetical protein NZK32_10655, partial [Cyanobium sp. FGCU-52]|nr:hypothetical protein [Cyanobium sp. FGCU52]
CWNQLWCSGSGILSKPYVARQDSLNHDILSLWGENIRFIKDYRDSGTDGSTGRIFIGTSAFCQGIGRSSLDNIREAYNQVSSIIGRFAPWLTPYTTVGSLAVDGVSTILKKLRDNKSECIESNLSLYPGSIDRPLPFGDAYLQRGSFLFFYEDLSDSEVSELFLARTGQIVTRSNNSTRIPPYVVINIVEGVVDAPSEIISRAAAVDILEKYQKQYSLDPNSGTSSMNLLLEGLQKIGDSYYYISQINRYRELASKGDRRSERETARMNEIKTEIENRFAQIKLVS